MGYATKEEKDREIVLKNHMIATGTAAKNMKLFGRLSQSDTFRFKFHLQPKWD